MNKTNHKSHQILSSVSLRILKSNTMPWSLSGKEKISLRCKLQGGF